MSTPIKQKGFTLLETIIYIGGLILLLGAILGFLASTYDWYRNAIIGSRVDGVGVAMADNLIRSIRSGESVNPTGTAFGTTTGSLSLNALDASSTAIIKKYALASGRMTYQENSGSVQYLSPSDITISRLYFTDIATPISEAVKFDIDITYNLKGVSQTRTYSGVAVMRNSYE